MLKIDQEISLSFVIDAIKSTPTIHYEYNYLKEHVYDPFEALTIIYSEDCLIKIRNERFILIDSVGNEILDHSYLLETLSLGLKQIFENKSINGGKTLMDIFNVEIKRHMDKLDTAFICAYKNGYTESQNKQRHKLLGLDLHMSGYSYYVCKGGYEETLYDENKNGIGTEFVIAESYIVFSYDFSKFQM
jgi:hypothetical protein